MMHPLSRMLFAVVVALLAACTNSASESQDAVAPVALVSIPAGQRDIRMPGQFMQGSAVVSAPMQSTRIAQDFSIMRRQVSQAEYAQCVSAGACKPLDKAYSDKRDPGLPVVGVSWVDATDYAKWYSRQTGQNYRLPTYAEWAHAAGDAFADIRVIDIADRNNPALRWLAEYALESARATTDSTPRPFGSFGVTSTRLLDVGGNVWDWTDTCFVTYAVDAEHDKPLRLSENCGIRVLAGKHIGYIIDFIRDPSSGACSVGIPPNNLGIRLVRDDAAHSVPMTTQGSLLKALL